MIKLIIFFFVVALFIFRFSQAFHSLYKKKSQYTHTEHRYIPVKSHAFRETSIRREDNVGNIELAHIK